MYEVLAYMFEMSAPLFFCHETEHQVWVCGKPVMLQTVSSSSRISTTHLVGILGWARRCGACHPHGAQSHGTAVYDKLAVVDCIFGFQLSSPQNLKSR